jgi:hypothetical protein
VKTRTREFSLSEKIRPRSSISWWTFWSYPLETILSICVISAATMKRPLMVIVTGLLNAFAARDWMFFGIVAENIIIRRSRRRSYAGVPNAWTARDCILVDMVAENITV